jgi:hypothetical protein
LCEGWCQADACIVLTNEMENFIKFKTHEGGREREREIEI